ncbi:MAG: alanine racemase, partial [Gammaproteobacteria bacterium]|nr:alanine racemase [Gammaproteobacteria bacterium]
LPIIVEHHLSIVIHQSSQVELLTQAQLAAPIQVWLKLDSGMHRLGLAPSGFLPAWQALRSSKNVEHDIVLMTHFARSEELAHPYTSEQLQLFNEITQDLDGPRSLANSAAIMAWPQTHVDWVRPGIMLYGISPFSDKTGIDLGLSPVMTLRSRLLSQHHYAKGEALGYNGTFICPEDMPVGLIATGYGDGYPRFIPSQGTPVLVNNQPTQIIARVSMDMIYVDLRPISNPQLGDDVILWGEGLPIERIAEAAKTNAYEIACGVGSRVEYSYSD